MSIIEAVSAQGRYCAPLVIFKGQNPQQQCVQRENIQNWWFTTSPNAWTSNQLDVEWLRSIVIPKTCPQAGPSVCRLLTLDNHGCHVSFEFQQLCVQNNIKLAYLPPHSSHILPPLNFKIFGAIKSRYSRAMASLENLPNGTQQRKRMFMEVFNEARISSLCKRNVENGFFAAGIWPIDRDCALSNPLRADPI